MSCLLSLSLGFLAAWSCHRRGLVGTGGSMVPVDRVEVAVLDTFPCRRERGNRNPTWHRVIPTWSRSIRVLAVDCSRLQSNPVRTGRTVFMQSKKTGGRDWTDPVQTVWTAVRTGLWRTLKQYRHIRPNELIGLQSGREKDVDSLARYFYRQSLPATADETTNPLYL